MRCSAESLRPGVCTDTGAESISFARFGAGRDNSGLRSEFTAIAVSAARSIRSVG